MDKNKSYLKISLLVLVFSFFIYQISQYDISDFTSNVIEDWKAKSFDIFITIFCLFLIVNEIVSLFKKKHK